jgi:hypothetical protein
MAEKSQTSSLLRKDSGRGKLGNVNCCVSTKDTYILNGNMELKKGVGFALDKTECRDGQKYFVLFKEVASL